MFFFFLILNIPIERQSQSRRLCVPALILAKWTAADPNATTNKLTNHMLLHAPPSSVVPPRLSFFLLRPGLAGQEERSGKCCSEKERQK